LHKVELNTMMMMMMMITYLNLISCQS